MFAARCTGTAGIEGEKGKKKRVGRKCNVLHTAVPSTLPALHHHWLLLSCSFVNCNSHEGTFLRLRASFDSVNKSDTS